MTDYIAKIKTPDGEARTIGGKNFDGQFTVKTLIGINNGSLAKNATKTISLASYLPNDGYDYELVFMTVANTGATSGNITRIYAYSGAGTSGFGTRVGLARTRSAYTEHFTNTSYLPIKSTDRNLTIKNAGNATSTGIYVYLKGYRRLGKNSTSSNYVSNISTQDKTIPIGGDNFDGQWVSKNVDILSGATISKGGSTKFSIGSYLPNDGHDYEVIVTGWGSTVATAGAHIRIKVRNGTPGKTNVTDFYMFGGITRTASTRAFGGTTTITVKSSDKNIVIENSGNNTATVSIRVRGYRKAGFNNNSNSYLENISISDKKLPIGGNNFDGQWVAKYSDVYNIKSPTASKAYYADISSYLPNDGHAYEVIADAYCQSSATSGAICEVYLNGHGQSLMVARNTTRTSSLVDNEATVILPIAKGKRTLGIWTGQSGTASIRVTFHAYRRLGTNT